MRFIQHKVGRFGFTAVSIDELGASEYTLIQLVIDGSGSMFAHRHRIEVMISDIVTACLQSEHRHRLILRIVAFGPAPEEVHGFKTMLQCNPADYDGVLRSSGTTALNDAVLDGIEVAGGYAEYLTKYDLLVNGLLIVVTDGMDNHSIVSPKQVKDALTDASGQFDPCELTFILVGLCDSRIPDSSGVSTALRRLQKEVGANGLGILQ
jgi:Mg-chelatase subunit ChlD